MAKALKKRQDLFFFFSFFPLWISTSHTSRLISIAIKRITSLSFSLSLSLRISLSLSDMEFYNRRKERKKSRCVPPPTIIYPNTVKEREREKRTHCGHYCIPKSFSVFFSLNSHRGKKKIKLVRFVFLFPPAPTLFLFCFYSDQF